MAALAVWWLRGGRGTPRLWGLLAALVALWGLTGLARASIATADAPRYVYAGAVLVVLAAAELLRGRRLADARAGASPPRSSWPGRPTRAGARCTPARSSAGSRATPARGWPPSTSRAPACPTSTARSPPSRRSSPGRCSQVQRDFGRIALTPAQLRRAPAVDREAADQTLLALSELSVQPAPGSAPGRRRPTLQARPGASVTVAADAPDRGAGLALRAARLGRAADDAARRLDDHHRRPRCQPAGLEADVRGAGARLPVSATRVAFVGRRGEHATSALSAPAGGLLPTWVEYRGDPAALRGALDVLRPDVVVVFAPAAVPAGTLAGLGALTLGFDLEPLPRTSEARARPEALFGLMGLSRAEPGQFDRLITTDPLAGAAARGAGVDVWRSLPLPVDDAYFAPVRRSPRPPRIAYLGPSTEHRERWLVGVKHRFDVLHVAHGLWGERLRTQLDRIDIALNLHGQPYASFEDRVLLHLASGHLVVSEPLAPRHGLEPGIDLLEADSPRALMLALERLHADPAPADAIRRRGRRKAETFRASRVWPRLLADLRADVQAFGGPPGLAPHHRRVEADHPQMQVPPVGARDPPGVRGDAHGDGAAGRYPDPLLVDGVAGGDRHTTPAPGQVHRQVGGAPPAAEHVEGHEDIQRAAGGVEDVDRDRRSHQRKTSGPRPPGGSSPTGRPTAAWSARPRPAPIRGRCPAGAR